jgi:hypothetical protein
LRVYRWIYALDAEADTRERFAAVSAQIKAELAANNDIPILPMSLLGDDKFDVPSISDERRREVAQMAKDMFDAWESSGPQVYKGKKKVRGEEAGARLGSAAVAAPVEPAGVAVAAVGA